MLVYPNYAKKYASTIEKSLFAGQRRGGASLKIQGGASIKIQGGTSLYMQVIKGAASLYMQVIKGGRTSECA